MVPSASALPFTLIQQSDPHNFRIVFLDAQHFIKIANHSMLHLPQVLDHECMKSHHSEYSTLQTCVINSVWNAGGDFPDRVPSLRTFSQASSSPLLEVKHSSLLHHQGQQLGLPLEEAYLKLQTSRGVQNPGGGKTLDLHSRSHNRNGGMEKTPLLVCQRTPLAPGNPWLSGPIPGNLLKKLIPL